MKCFFFSEKRHFGKQLQNITNNYKNIFFILLWNLRFKTIFSWKLHCFFRFQKSLIFNFFSIKTYFCWWKKWVFVKKGCNRLRPSANKNPRIVFQKNNHQICDHLELFFCEKNRENTDFLAFFTTLWSPTCPTHSRPIYLYRSAWPATIRDIRGQFLL